MAFLFVSAVATVVSWVYEVAMRPAVAATVGWHIIRVATGAVVVVTTVSTVVVALVTRL